MKRVIIMLVVGVFVLGLALSADAQQKAQQQSGQQQQQQSGQQQQQPSQQQQGQQQSQLLGKSINVTISKVNQEEGTVNVMTEQGTRLSLLLLEKEEQEAKNFLQQLKEGEQVTVQISSSQQQQQKQQQQAKQEQQGRSVRVTITKVDEELGSVNMITEQGLALSLLLLEKEAPETQGFLQQVKEGNILTAQISAAQQQGQQQQQAQQGQQKQQQQGQAAQATQQQQPKQTKDQQQQQAQTQQQQQQSLKVTINKVDKEEGTMNLQTDQGVDLKVRFIQSESQEAQQLMEKFEEGKQLTVRVGQSEMGTGGAQQQQPSPQAQPSPQKQQQQKKQ